MNGLPERNLKLAVSFDAMRWLPCSKMVSTLLVGLGGSPAGCSVCVIRFLGLTCQNN